MFRSLKQDCPYDFVIERKGVLERVQVKYREIKKGVVKVKILQGLCKTNNNISYNKAVVDFIAIYIVNIGKIVYLPIEDFEDLHDIIIRVDPTKNNQVFGVTPVEKYLNW